MYPMGMVTQRMTQGRWRSKMFTTSTTFVVPADVGHIWIDGCAAGGNGGAGYNGTGGGGGGGSQGVMVEWFGMSVEPEETIIITIGAVGGITSVASAGMILRLNYGTNGANGTATNGGSGGAYFPIGTGATGGAGAGPIGVTSGPGSSNVFYYAHANTALCRSTSGGAGGAPNFNGGGVFGSGPWTATGFNLTAGGTGNASGGGGGAGGNGPYGTGGAGGNSGAVGSPATGYGCGGGGGGGGGVFVGGAGSPGMIRIHCFTAYAI